MTFCMFEGHIRLFPLMCVLCVGQIQNQYHICFCIVLWLIFYGTLCLAPLDSVGCALQP